MNSSRLPLVFLSNVRPLQAKIDDLQTVVQQNNVDVVAITETWLNSKMNDDLVSLSGYSIVRNDRDHGRRGGGVCSSVASLTI